jgi:hypothetical protein
LDQELAMAQVIYNGNGSDGGQVPVDSNAYVAGDTVNDGVNDTTKPPYEQTDSHNNSLGIVTGNLTKTGATFLYWSTAPDGGGTIHGWPADTSFSFPNQSTDLTLYAQWAITTGLTNGGVTAHYTFSYDASLEQTASNPGGLEPARTNAVIANCETDFGWMAGLFTGVDITKATSLPIVVYVTALNGGANTTAQIRVRPGTNGAVWIRALLVAEVTEIFMHAQGKGWGFAAGVSNEQSCGESLSLFLTEQFQLHIGQPLISTNSGDAWLNSSLPPTSNPNSTRFYDHTSTSQGYDYGSRVDYVNATLNWPGNGPGTGCSILFLYYLYHQLGFKITDIIAAAPRFNSSGEPNDGACLRGVYQNLTGDTSDPFPFFAQLLATAYPPSQVSSIAGSNPDDPWPIGLLSFTGVKNTWGPDEVADIIAKGGTWPDGFYLMLEGFNRNVVGSTVPSVPAIAFGGATTKLDTSPPGILYETTNPKIPQRILFPYDVKFAKPLGAFPTSGETPVAVTTGITILGTLIPASTEFFFLAGADPYFTNVLYDPSNPSGANAYWLSEDLRVFTATPGAPPAAQYQYPVPGGPQFVEHSVGGNYDFAGAYTYIQALIEHLNHHYGDPGGQDPFDPTQKIVPQQAGAYAADSSVVPTTTVGGQAYNNYGFAIARVRLRGSQGGAGAANGVKVFFRLWGTQTADTDWQPTTTYLSHNDAQNNPLWPLAPSDDHTIPFFATSAAPNFTDPNDPEFQVGGTTGTGANNQTITIKQGDWQWAYFGCYLNVNDPNLVVNNQVVPLAFPGTHHCLVAQIAFAGSPIQSVGSAIATPESSDLLAQRNLQVTTSDNPGPPSTHRVPQTFDVRWSGPAPTHGPLAGRPDELIIDWGNTPAGATARIYWPGTTGAEVLSLASWMYGVHALTAADAHTIQITTVKGVSYVPIPFGSGAGLAGLFTVDLPQTVVTGQEFDIVVRRIATRPLAVPPPPPPPPPQPKIAIDKAHSAPRTDAAVAPSQSFERYITGSFQVKIPVTTRDEMLPAEETTLAILKARLAAMPKTNRWYPVLLRYIGQVSGRVDGLGHNAAAIPPSLHGYPPPGGGGHHGGGSGGHHGNRPCDDDLVEFTGKVCEATFDCFGAFVGFVLDDCCERHAFESRKREIGELILRALKEDLTLSVFVTRKDHRIARLVVRA